MTIKNPKENLPGYASKVFLDIHGVLVGFIKCLRVISSLSHKRVSNTYAFKLNCLCCPILESRPVVLAGDWPSGWDVMGEPVEIAWGSKRGSISFL